MHRKYYTAVWGSLALLIFGLGGRSVGGDEPAGAAAAPATPAKTLAADPPGMTRLLPDVNAWVDRKSHRVVIDGTVCLRRGTLEMFACLTGTKEHESIVAVDVPAHAIHAGLLLVGAKPGSPAKFQPEFHPASGTTIDIAVTWRDEKKETQTAKANDWIRNLRTGKPLGYDWIFAGSSFFTDEQGKQHYQAEGGDLICVSNFPSAMLDLPIESSQATSDLIFEAWTDRIPPIGTKVRLVLTPRLEKTPAKK